MYISAFKKKKKKLCSCYGNFHTMWMSFHLIWTYVLLRLSASPNIQILLHSLFVYPVFCGLLGVQVKALLAVLCPV